MSQLYYFEFHGIGYTYKCSNCNKNVNFHDDYCYHCGEELTMKLFEENFNPQRNEGDNNFKKKDVIFDDERNIYFKKPKVNDTVEINMSIFSVECMACLAYKNWKPLENIDVLHIIISGIISAVIYNIYNRCSQNKKETKEISE